MLVSSIVAALIGVCGSWDVGRAISKHGREVWVVSADDLFVRTAHLERVHALEAAGITLRRYGLVAAPLESEVSLPADHVAPCRSGAKRSAVRAKWWRQCSCKMPSIAAVPKQSKRTRISHLEWEPTVLRLSAGAGATATAPRAALCAPHAPWAADHRWGGGGVRG
eukprot:SAG31_NODE_2037_length_6604_cov_2.820600_6_plen_166_part_00